MVFTGYSTAGAPNLGREILAMSTSLTRLYLTVRNELGSRLHEERGDGPVDNAILISIGVTVALVLGGLITAAVNRYGASIR